MKIKLLVIYIVLFLISLALYDFDNIQFVSMTYYYLQASSFLLYIAAILLLCNEVYKKRKPDKEITLLAALLVFLPIFVALTQQSRSHNYILSHGELVEGEIVFYKPPERISLKFKYSDKVYEVSTRPHSKQKWSVGENMALLINPKNPHSFILLYK